ncbi:hypothetical protein [Psychrobacter sp. AH5]
MTEAVLKGFLFGVKDSNGNADLLLLIRIKCLKKSKNYRVDVF